MKFVYTDNRFPGVEIVNEDSRVFEVRQNGRVVTTFSSWDQPNGTITEAFAQRRASDYFERQAKSSLQEAVENFSQLPPGTGDDVSDIVNAPPSAAQHSRVIDQLIAREAMEADPAKKERMRQNILHLMKQEESQAEAVVNHLIES